MSGAPTFVYPLVGLFLGAIVGSFIATVLIRWPQGRSVVSERSRCDSCGKDLSPTEMVPVLSFALGRGRCRSCGAAIDRRHLLIEIAAAMLGLVALVAHPLPLAIVTTLLGLWLLLIALLDLEHQWLPDRLTLPLVPLGLLAAWAGFGPPLVDRAAGALVGWASLALIAFAYRRMRGREGMGGGDPRLFAAIGAWVGLFQLPFVLLGGGLAGLAAAALMKMRGNRIQATTRLPLGTLLVLAAWPVWLVVAPG